MLEHAVWIARRLQGLAQDCIVEGVGGVVFQIIVGIAPLLGLVGTILGMITTFGNVGQTGLTDAAKLAQGISLILRATLFGLLIAIPALIFWSYYTKKVETTAVEMESLCDEFVRRQFRAQLEGPKPKGHSLKPNQPAELHTPAATT